MATTQLIVFCYLPGATTAVPAGLFEHDDQSGVGIFRYGSRYQARENALALDCTSLPLGRDADPVILNGGLYGAFRDASPDFWGRLVISRQLRQPIESITEVDYLTHANATRVGNLDFRPTPESPEPTLMPPQYSDLEDLLEAAGELERGRAIDERIQLLLEQGSSLGGARPKCTVECNGELWLAKFPAGNDRLSIPRLEFATMQLASTCGLNVPAIRLVDVGGEHVFLIRRFDREAVPGGWTRRGYLSALSIAGWDDRDRTRWSYQAVAAAIRRYSVRVEADLSELFLRIAFNILVRNTDDHPRNHGFIAKGEGVVLSPLFDVVPALTPRGVGTEFSLAMGIGVAGRLASVDNLCSAAPAFNLSQCEAVALTTALRQQIAESWRAIFTEAGIAEEDQVLIAPSMGE